MPVNSTNGKQQAHELIERLAPSQVPAVVGMLEALLEPVSRAVTNAPVDEEPESEAERRSVAESKQWFDRRGGRGIPHERVVAEFRLPPSKTAKRKR